MLSNSSNIVNIEQQQQFQAGDYSDVSTSPFDSATIGVTGSSDWITIIPFEEDDEPPSSDEKHISISKISFLLSIFDNIVGPKVVHFWQTSSLQKNNATTSKTTDATASTSPPFKLDQQLLKYIAIHTLNGELYHDKLVNQLKYRLYLIKVFFEASTVNTISYGGGADASGTAKVSTTLNCFSLIIPLKNKDLLLSHYGDNTKFFINAFENYILEYKVLAQIRPKVNKVTTAIEHLTQAIFEFCSSLCTLKMRGILSSSYLKHKKRLLVTTDSDVSINIKDTFLNECYFVTPSYSSINNDFLVNALTSHLITNFNTIVIGKSSSSINKIINTLALFTPREKWTLCCYALEELAFLSPYFYIQGFVTENPEDLNLHLTSDFIFKKDSPTTIVDLSYKQVYRTPILNEFNSIKEVYTQNKIKILYNSLTFDDLRKLFPVMDYLSWVPSIDIASKSTLVTNMLKQMDVLDSDFGIKDSFVELTKKEFYLLALSFIEYVNNESVNNINKKEKFLKLSMKKICKDLDIRNEDDLNIIIAYANYLKPNFTLYLIFQA